MYKNELKKRAAEIVLSTMHMNDSVTNEKSYKFMEYNQKSLPLLPYGHISYFHAYLTYKSGVNEDVIDLMIPLLDSELKINHSVI